MLRVGITLESLRPNAWIAYLLDQIQQSSYARIQLAILIPPVRQNHNLLFRRYEEWDYARNRNSSDFRATGDVTALLKDVPKLQLQAADPADDSCTSALSAADLDVILQLDTGGLPATALHAARYGIWSLHQGRASTKDEAPLFWEVFEGDPVSETTLQVLTSSSAGPRVIYRSFSATNQRSLQQNRNPIYWKSAELMLRRLHDLDAYGWHFINSLPSDPQRTASKNVGTPSTGQMVNFLAGQFGRAARASVQARIRGGFTQWFLALRRRSPEHRFDSPADYQRLPLPDDRFYADPMLVTREGRTWLFFEDYRFGDSRARLSCCEVATDGSFGEPIEVLQRPYHLSYPFVFEWKGQMYMIPETRENKAIELYRAEEFPEKWLLDKVLMGDVSAVDATIHQEAGRLWMFAGTSSGRYSTCDELSIFFSDSLHGPWQPHQKNPVISDVRCARPAGALFFEDGKLIRPSQDCAKAYGYALNFSEVLTLTDTEYEERIIGRITPDWSPGNLGTHTYTRSADFEVIDGNVPKKLR